MRHATIAAAAVVLAGVAAAQDVRYNYDNNADFSQYRTYRWQKHPNSTDLDELTMNQLSAALDAELAQKGLARTEGESDLLIVYQLAFSHEKEITTFNTGYGYGPGWGRGWYGAMGTGMSTATTSTITIGSLALDMFDTKTKTLVWRGVATKTVEPKNGPEKRQKSLRKAAGKLLKNYPPKKKT